MRRIEQHNVPKLRFPGFDEAWQERHLSDFCDVISGHPIPGDDILEEQTGVPLLRGINITEGRIRHSVDIDRYLGTSTEGLERFFVEAGDVVLGMDGSKVGKNVAIVTDSDAGAFLIQRVARMRSTGANILDFAYHLIFSPLFHRYVDRINTSSGIPHISLKQIRDFKIPSPSPDEQRKIASFLGAVDTKIAQLAEKKRLLEDYKKGCMQLLFSQAVRFKDEDGNDFPDWEEKRLGEVLTIGSGRDYKHLGTGNIPVHGTGGLMTFVEDFLHDGESVCIGRKGTIDKPVFLTGKFWTVDTLFYTHSFQNAVPRFIYAIFQQINWQMHNEASGVPSLSKSTIERLKVSLPHPDEQCKIADFLSALDRKIDLVGQELAHARSFKQGLLQQMFV